MPLDPGTTVDAAYVDPGAAVAGKASSPKADLAKAAGKRVFFGHQSVGQNVLDGIPAAYRQYGVAAPFVVERTVPAGRKGGFVVHAYIGENEKPLTKIKDFDSRIRSGIGNQVDVAMMKFCWIDFTTSTNVTALFTEYKNTIAKLEKDYPNVTFVKVTVPLMTNPGMLNKLKTKLGGGDRYGTAENVVREQFNALMRKQYAGKNLFDLAAVQSTTPDGKRVVGKYQGKTFYALYDGYASDRGHLNADGQKRAATAWARFVAKAAK